MKIKIFFTFILLVLTLYSQGQPIEKSGKSDTEKKVETFIIDKTKPKYYHSIEFGEKKLFDLNQLILMSQSHLANVQNTINDLESKKLEIDQEVNRLKEYLKNGIELLQQFNTSSSVDNVVSKNVSRPYLGE